MKIFYNQHEGVMQQRILISFSHSLIIRHSIVILKKMFPFYYFSVYFNYKMYFVNCIKIIIFTIGILNYCGYQVAKIKPYNPPVITHENSNFIWNDMCMRDDCHAHISHLSGIMKRHFFPSGKYFLPIYDLLVSQNYNLWYENFLGEFKNVESINILVCIASHLH